MKWITELRGGGPYSWVKVKNVMQYASLVVQKKHLLPLKYAFRQCCSWPLLLQQSLITCSLALIYHTALSLAEPFQPKSNLWMNLMTILALHSSSSQLWRWTIIIQFSFAILNMIISSFHASMWRWLWPRWWRQPSPPSCLMSDLKS